MRSLTLSCIVSVLALGIGSSAVPPTNGKLQVSWQSDYEFARSEARLLRRPLLVHVTTKWCPACLRLERTTFVDFRVVEFINQSLVAAKVDADASPELTKRLGVERLPTSIVFATDGTVLGRIEGYASPKRYAEELMKLVQVPKQDSTTSSTRAPKSPVRTAVLTKAQDGYRPNNAVWLSSHTQEESPRPPAVMLSVQFASEKALEGLCPVTLAGSKRMVLGEPEYEVECDGHAYWLAGAEELEKFRADPPRYAPVLGGLCVASFLNQGLETPGRAQFGATYHGRLYLFAGAEERRQFQAEPKRYADCDLTAEGHCPVCKTELGTDVAGSKDFQLIRQGRLTRFDSPEHRDIFLTEPNRFCQPK